jgi:hypothetical protein
MKIGNPKIKSHNVQMKTKPIKYLKKYGCKIFFIAKKKFGNFFLKFKMTFENKCNFKLFKSP